MSKRDEDGEEKDVIEEHIYFTIIIRNKLVIKIPLPLTRLFFSLSLSVGAVKFFLDVIDAAREQMLVYMGYFYFCTKMIPGLCSIARLFSTLLPSNFTTLKGILEIFLRI